MSFQNPQVTSNAPELAAFCVVMGGLSLNMLNSLKGNLCNIDKFVASRTWPFMKTSEGTTSSIHLKFFRIIIICLIFMPIISLGVWAGTLFYEDSQLGNTLIAPESVLMVGICLYSFFLGIFYIKWRLYKSSYVSLVFMMIGGAAFIVYQVCGNFLQVAVTSFFNISAIFLSYNDIVFMIAIFLNAGNSAMNFKEILENTIKERDEVSPYNPEEPLSKQLVEQQTNKAYRLTKEELDVFFTLKEEDAMLLSGGLINEYGNLTPAKQYWSCIFIYIFSVGILVGYAFIIYYCTTEYKLGFITLIATITTDTIIYSFARIDSSQSVLQLCFLSIVFRACLFGFGGTYWFYGYCLLYFIVGLIVCNNITYKHFPLIDAIQAEAAEMLTAGKKKESKIIDLMNSPWFILIYTTFLFGVVTIALALAQPDGVPLPSLYSSTNEYKFWTMAILAVGAVIFIYFVMAIIRMLIRKRQKIIDSIFFYFFSPMFDIFWIHCYLCYGLLIIGGLIAYGLSGNNVFIICCCYLPLVTILIIYVYFYYCANDYRVLKDIKQENATREFLRKKYKDEGKKLAKEKQRLSILSMNKNESNPIKELDNLMMDSANSPKASKLGTPEKSLVVPKKAEKQEEEKKDPLSALADTHPEKPLAAKEQSGSPSNKEVKKEEKDNAKTPENNNKDNPLNKESKESPKSANQPPDSSHPEVPAHTDIKALDSAGTADLAKKEEKKTDEVKDGPPSKAEEQQLDFSDRPAIKIEKKKSRYEGKMTTDEKDHIDLFLEASEEMDPLEDWTETENVVGAFLKGKLHQNDYRIIVGIAGIIILIFLNSLTIQATNNYNGGWPGVTLGFILFDSFATLGPLFKFLRTDLDFNLGQLFALVVGLIAHILYGVLYFIVREGCDMDAHQNEIWVWFYLIFVPGFIAVLTGLYKYHHRKWSVNPFTIVMTIITFGLIVVFTVFLWVRKGWTAGIITLGIDALILYGAVMSYFYAANDYHFSCFFKISNVGIIILAMCAVMLASWIVPSFEPFIGFTITFALIIGIGAVYFFIQLISMCHDDLLSPIFFSPYVFPAYQYSAIRDTSVHASFNVLGLYFCLLCGIFWSIMLSIYLQPMYYGVSVSAIIIVLMTYLTMFLITRTPMLLQACEKEITIENISENWVRAKRKYVQHLNAITLSDIATYDSLSKAYEAVQGRTLGENGKVQLNSEITLPVNSEKMSEKELDQILEKIEDEMSIRYMDEIHLMIDFQLLCLMSITHARVAAQTQTHNFLIDKGSLLKSFGIDIKFKGISDPIVRHSLIMGQINKLSPEKHVKYNEIYASYQKELEEARKRHDEEEKAAAEAEMERNKGMAEVHKKKKTIPNQEGLEIDQMIDCEFKYKKILEKFQADKKPYLDKQFPGPDGVPESEDVCDGVLGDQNWRNINGASKWTRGDGMVLYDKEISAIDVKQGMLGDCYFLSAISVMGAENVLKILISKKEEVECGAFCVKFFRGGEEEEYVVIDNYFPAGMAGFSFVQSEDGNELWPMVLEKAYAKLYGGYKNIEKGKVHYALAELTGGASEQVDLTTIVGQKEAFWLKLMKFHKNGYLMGAGSPPPRPNSAPQPGGGGGAVLDVIESPNRIIQGHAYGVLDIAEFEGNQLMMMRNPHGSAGVEWNGPWADGSPEWSEAARAKLHYQEKSDDGCFWMPYTSFLTEFRMLYICRTFDEKQWKPLCKEVRNFFLFYF